MFALLPLDHHASITFLSVVARTFHFGSFAALRPIGRGKTLKLFSANLSAAARMSRALMTHCLADHQAELHEREPSI